MTAVRRVLQARGLPAGGAACCALALATVAAGCGSSTHQRPAAMRPASGPPATVYFRPVDCILPYPPPAPGTGRVLPDPASACRDPHPRTVADTPRSVEAAGASVVVPDRSGRRRYVLGPADLTAADIESATVVAPSTTGEPGGPVSGSGTGGSGAGDTLWSVDITFTPAGTAAINRVAQQRYSHYQQPVMAASLEAIEVDGVVQAAPTIQSPSYPSTITITGNFTRAQTEALVQRIRSAIHR